jgi:hypothetical protein
MNDIRNRNEDSQRRLTTKDMILDHTNVFFVTCSQENEAISKIDRHEAWGIPLKREIYHRAAVSKRLIRRSRSEFCDSRMS